MSRMVKKQLAVVENTKFSNSGDAFVVSGKLGNIKINLNKKVSVELEGNGLRFKSLTDEDNGMLGTSFVLVKNAMNDLQNGFTAKLKMVGVGFKANVVGKFLRVYVGFSHDVFFGIPEGITVEVKNDVEILIKGYNRHSVMQFARAIRDIKKPEPYKGKGIFLNDEKVLRKEGKKK